MKTFDPTKDGMKRASVVNASATMNYFTSRTMGHTSVSNFYERADEENKVEE